MIKINKFENIYGIKKVTGIENMKRINVIYAPNGTAKSSLADGLQCISQNKPIDDYSDVYHNLENPVFEIDVDGNICTETNHIAFDVLKYSGVNDFDLNHNLQYSNIVISESIRNQINVSINQINAAQQAIKNLVDSIFVTKKDTKPFKDSIALIGNTTADDPDLYLKLIQNIDFTSLQLPVQVTENMFISLVSEKAKKSCDNQEVINGATNYFQIVNNKKNQNNIFEIDFTIDNLIDFHNNAIKNNYYKSTAPERKLFINNIQYDKDGIQELINNEINNKYGSEDAKTIFDSIKKTLGKNTKVVDQLNAYPQLIPFLNNYNNLINKLFVTICSNIKNELISELIAIQNAQSKINTISNNSIVNDNKITEIWKKFQSRFKFKKFDLKIENQFNAVIGKELPRFVKYIPNTTEKITDPKILRFSTGEIKTYNLINFILTVETKILDNQEFTIILDDAVDSFDYKNKYGIIDYLLDIKDNPNVQMIILTHNFDFYRSAILALGKGNPELNQYFAYKNSNDEINFSLITGTQKYYLEFTNFNSWKNNPTISQYFALIAFSRNIIQLETSGRNTALIDLDNYLHFDNSLIGKTLNDLQLILNPKMNINLPATCTPNDLYLIKLSEIIENIINNRIIVIEIDLEYKLAIGLYIRIFLERYLTLLYKSNTNIYPTITNTYARTRDLINLTKPYLLNEDLEKVIEANVISPAYIHANSFMYEPLIDVCSNDLIEIATWIYNQNLTWRL